MRSDRTGYECGLEVYHPNFCGRQLGFRQAISVPFFDSLHYGTSFYLHSPSKITFRVAQRSLKVMSKIAHKLMALNFDYTPSFATWWKAKWLRKYDRDIREAHDRLFRQVFFKSFHKNDEFENWNKAINQKNQLLLIGKSHYFCFAFLHAAFIICHLLTLILVLQPKAILKKWMSDHRWKLQMPWFFKRLLRRQQGKKLGPTKLLGMLETSQSSSVN